ncbi:MAG: hypothetical protein L3J58_11820 [Emcibacter sp.]|nr:hypothetical protein [Emcibacter sp.]
MDVDFKDKVIGHMAAQRETNKTLFSRISASEEEIDQMWSRFWALLWAFVIGMGTVTLTVLVNVFDKT